MGRLRYHYGRNKKPARILIGSESLLQSGSKKKCPGEERLNPPGQGLIAQEPGSGSAPGLFVVYHKLLNV